MEGGGLGLHRALVVRDGFIDAVVLIREVSEVVVGRRELRIDTHDVPVGHRGSLGLFARFPHHPSVEAVDGVGGPLETIVEGVGVALTVLRIQVAACLRILERCHWILDAGIYEPPRRLRAAAAGRRHAAQHRYAHPSEPDDPSHVPLHGAVATGFPKPPSYSESDSATSGCTSWIASRFAVPTCEQ